MSNVVTPNADLMSSPESFVSACPEPFRELFCRNGGECFAIYDEFGEYELLTEGNFEIDLFII